MKYIIIGFIIIQTIYFLYANYTLDDEFAYHGFANEQDYQNYRNEMKKLLNQPADKSIIDKINKLQTPNLEIYNMMNYKPYFVLSIMVVRLIVGISFWLAVFILLSLFCHYVYMRLYGRMVIF